MKISVIVPLFNAEKYILRCIQSIAAQKCESEIECILVDDCGWDRSIEIVQSYIDNYCGHASFSIIHHNTNKGASASRNTGIRHATGQYLIFVDSDDYLKDGAFSFFETAIKDRQNDIVLAAYEDEHGMIHKYDIISGQYENNHALLSCFAHSSIYTAWNKMVSTSFIKENCLFFDESLQVWEDVLWSYSVAVKINSFYALPSTPLYHYSSNIDSVTHKKSSEEIIRNCSRSLSIIGTNLNLGNADRDKSVLFFRNAFKHIINMTSTIDADLQKDIYINILYDNKEILKKIYRFLPIKYMFKDLYHLFPDNISYFVWRCIFLYRRSL